MRRLVVLLAGLLLISGVATWVGVAVAQKEDPAKAGAGKPGFEGWKYPGAKELGSGQGAGGFQVMLATTDGLDKVEAFYGKKTGGKLAPDAPGGNGIGGVIKNGQAVEFRVSQDDSVEPGGKPGPKPERPVVVRILVQRTKGYDLALVISRAKGEDHTHIALTYFPK